MVPFAHLLHLRLSLKGQVGSSAQHLRMGAILLAKKNLRSPFWSESASSHRQAEHASNGRQSCCSKYLMLFSGKEAPPRSSSSSGPRRTRTGVGRTCRDPLKFTASDK